MALNSNNKTMLFPRLNKIIIIFFSIALIITGIISYRYYSYIFSPNVNQPGSITIPMGARLEQVIDSLTSKKILINEKAFRWVSKKKKYEEYIKQGRYRVEKGLNTNSIVNMLISGNQEAIKVTFNNVRFMDQLAGKVSQYFTTDSLTMLQHLTDVEVMEKYGFNEQTFQSMFIPNTYEMYWTTTPDKFTERMKTEYDRFWNDERKAKAKAIGLSPVEVATLASIVQEETIKNDEKPIVAGLYLNRLSKGILLQADPTIKFALGDFTIRRVLETYLEIDSPYNTYKYTGLPPGPINFPEISSIEAVLNPDKNSFLYMCAREDFSGYHNFAKTLAEHNRNAQRYQSALNKQKIWR